MAARRKASPAAAAATTTAAQAEATVAEQKTHDAASVDPPIAPPKWSFILKKISDEYQIIEMVENVCNLKKMESDWILKIDIVEQGDKLELVEQDTEDLCNAECKTIELACREAVDYSDTDIAEHIFSSKPTLDALVNQLIPFGWLSIMQH